MFENLKWKKTKQGRYIQLFASSENLQFPEEKPLLFIGGVHGDEPEGVYLAEALLDWIKNVYQKQHTEKKYLAPWVLIPCLNPDGYAENQRVNSNGVDLNRNFPAADWSNDYKQQRYYPGERPGSEIETQSLMELLKQVKPKVIIHFHSWKPSIVYTGDQALPLAKIFSEISKYELQSDIGYPTPGSLGQYGYLECKTGVICIEEREGADKKETWTRFAKAFERILMGQ
jgi:hypothetical protein